MRLIGRLPARELEGADRVMEGFVGQLASGNYCRFWPAVTEFVEDGVPKTRVAFLVEWYSAATPADTEELMLFTNTLMEGDRPMAFTESHGNPFEDQRNVDWLRDGKPPEGGKTH